MVKTYEGIIHRLKKNEIFVFGSNTQGRHGKGAALLAKRKFNAIYGQAKGFQGQSYAIVTKDLTKQIHPSVSFADIVLQIGILYGYAAHMSAIKFYIAYTGNATNLNAYTPQEVADMFSTFVIPDNIVFEKEFSKLLNRVG